MTTRAVFCKLTGAASMSPANQQYPSVAVLHLTHEPPTEGAEPQWVATIRTASGRYLTELNHPEREEVLLAARRWCEGRGIEHPFVARGAQRGVTGTARLCRRVELLQVTAGLETRVALRDPEDGLVVWACVARDEAGVARALLAAETWATQFGHELVLATEPADRRTLPLDGTGR